MMKSRFHRFVFLVPGLIVLGLSSAFAQLNMVDEDVARACARAPFAMPAIHAPRFPDRIFSLTSFGAVPDGFTLCTAAFAAAIDSCAASGGGTVLVPPGTWLTGPIQLKSNLRLHLERGALVQMSDRIEDFPLKRGPDPMSHKFVVTPPISAYDAHNIAITGEGTIDGAGERWRYVLKEKQTDRQWQRLVASGGAVSADGKQWWPSAEALHGEEYLQGLEKTNLAPTASDYGKAKEYLRPDLVSFYRCDSILFDGPTFRNSPRYHLHPVHCEHIIIRNVTVLTEWYAMNGDGIDLSGCRNVVVCNSMLDVGDDGLCLKPRSLSPRQAPGPSCSQIVIDGCTVYHAHGGFVIGSESYGGVRDVSVRNCTFIGTDVGIRFKSARGRGGLVERVFVDGIQMRDIMTEAVLLDMYYSGGSPEVESAKDRSVRLPQPLNDRTPRFQDITIKNIVCQGAERALLINGLPELPIRNIRFDSITIASRLGVLIVDAEGIRLNQVHVRAQSGPAVEVNQGDDIVIEGGSYTNGHHPLLRVDGEGSRAIVLRGVDAKGTSGAIERGKDVRPDAIRVNGN